MNGPDGAGIELARQSDRVGLYMTHGNGDMLAASIEENKKYGDVLQNGPSIRLSDGTRFSHHARSGHPRWQT